MKRFLISALLLILAAPTVQALTITPDTVFTVRDDRPVDGIPDESSVGSGGFTGFVTTEDFVDETFIEFAVGSKNVTNATFILEMLLQDNIGINKTVDISSYNNGIGSVQVGLFGTGGYITTVPVTGFFTLNIINLDVSALYNSAVAASDDFLGFRLHDVVAIDGSSVQAFYNDSSLMLSEVPLPAAIWLFGAALIGLAGISKRKKRLNR